MFKIFLVFCCIYVAKGFLLPHPRIGEGRNALKGEAQLRLPLVFDSSNPRIVGGSNALEGAAPHQASLRTFYDFHFCGGSIISKRWILTAAHCTLGESGYTMKVVVGTNSLSKGGQSYAIDKIAIHKDFNYNEIKNDVSVIRVLKDIEFSSLVQPIQLPDANTPGGANLSLTGWGTTSFPGSAPDNLQIIKLLSLSVKDCQDIYSRVNAPDVDSTQICSLTKQGEGACHGDSGGPLVEGDRVVGVVSWGMPCARGYPDVYSRVFAFKDWINNTTNNLS